MNFMFYISLFACFSYLLMGTSTLIINWKAVANRIFFLMCLSFAFWSFCSISIFSGLRPETNTFWLNLSFYGVLSFCAFSLHFIVRLTDLINWRPILWPVIYLPPAVLLGFHTFYGPLLFKDVLIQNDTWIFVQTGHTILMFLYIIYVCMTFTANITLLVIWNARSQTKRIRQQGVLLTATLFLSIVLGVSEDMVLPMLIENYNSHGFGLVFFLIWMLGIWFSILRYQFLLITPDKVSWMIMTNLDDSILLLDRNLAIKMLNRKAEHTLGYSHKPAQPKFLSDFFELNDSFRINWTKLVHGKVENFSGLLTFKAENSTASCLEAKLTAVRDRGGDFAGVLCKGNVADDIFSGERDMKIRKKEREILSGILNGKTHREIALSSGITERTVKFHINNLYNKFGVGNRAQLLGALSDYYSLPARSSKKTLFS